MINLLLKRIFYGDWKESIFTMYIIYLKYLENFKINLSYCFKYKLLFTKTVYCGPRSMNFVTMAAKVIYIILMVCNVTPYEYQSPENVSLKSELVCAMTLQLYFGLYRELKLNKCSYPLNYIWSRIKWQSRFAQTSAEEREKTFKIEK